MDCAICDGIVYDSGQVIHLSSRDKCVCLKCFKELMASYKEQQQLHSLSDLPNTEDPSPAVLLKKPEEQPAGKFLMVSCVFIGV